MRSTPVFALIALCVGWAAATQALTAAPQLPDLLNPDRQSDAGNGRGNAPATATEPERRELEEKIEGLKRALESVQPEGFADLAAVRRRAREYRNRVENIKKLHLPDAPPDPAVDAAVSAFQRRWSDLAAPIMEGRIPGAPIDPARWAVYARRFDDFYCGSVPATAPRGGMRPAGMAWACLADLYFRDLSETAFHINTILTADRTQATRDLENAMKLVELKLAGALGTEPQSFVDRVGELLHAVDKEGIRLQLRDLENRLSNSDRIPAFRWFLDLGPIVFRTDGGLPAALAQPASARLVLRTAGKQLEAFITGLPAQTQLARELHQIHYRLLVLEQSGGDPEDRRQKLNQAARERARVLAQMAQTN